MKLPDEIIADTSKQAGSVLINQGPLGALVILLAIAVGVLIWVVIKSKNAHIQDKDKMIGLLNEHSLEVQGLLKDTKTAIDILAKDTYHLKMIIENVDRENGEIRQSLNETKKAVENLGQQWNLWNITHSQKG